MNAEDDKDGMYDVEVCSAEAEANAKTKLQPSVWGMMTAWRLSSFCRSESR